MSRGRAFICWIGPNGSHDVALHQGDACEYLVNKKWWRGTIHYRTGWYCFHTHRRWFCVYFAFHLRPIQEKPK